jgi:hypothetical protein
MIHYVGASARAMAGFEHVADPSKVARIILPSPNSTPAVAAARRQRCLRARSRGDRTLVRIEGVEAVTDIGLEFSLPQCRDWLMPRTCHTPGGPTVSSGH